MQKHQENQIKITKDIFITISVLVLHNFCVLMSKISLGRLGLLMLFECSWSAREIFVIVIPTRYNRQKKRTEIEDCI